MKMLYEKGRILAHPEYVINIVCLNSTFYSHGGKMISLVIQQRGRNKNWKTDRYKNI